MKSPKFTDQDRFRDAPYTRANETDITQSWARARLKLEQDAKERAEKVKKIREIGVRK
jgi:hypothetical protein